jgi:hypothetical protein
MGFWFPQMWPKTYAMFGHICGNQNSIRKLKNVTKNICYVLASYSTLMFWCTKSQMWPKPWNMFLATFVEIKTPYGNSKMWPKTFVMIWNIKTGAWNHKCGQNHNTFFGLFFVFRMGFWLHKVRPFYYVVFLFGFLAQSNTKRVCETVSNYLNRCPRFFFCPKFEFFLFFRVRPIAAHSAHCFSYRYFKIMNMVTFFVFRMGFWLRKVRPKTLYVLVQRPDFKTRLRLQQKYPV